MQEQRYLNELKTALPEYGVNLGSEAMVRLSQYLTLLSEWNPKMRLVGSVEPVPLVRRHVAESLWLSQLIPLHRQTVVDVGSGAGFPGMALQLAWPELQVTLVEVNAKKVAFLKAVARTFGMGRVMQGRLEEVVVEADIVTARALEHMEAAGPDRFRHLVAPGGVAAFWIGEETVRSWSKFVGSWEWEASRTVPGSERRTITLARRRQPVDE